MNVLVFSIKTIPDIEGGQRIFGLEGLDEKSTAKAMFHLQQQQTGTDCLPLHLHQIASFSIVYRGMGDDMGNLLSVRSFGDEKTDEATFLDQFFEEIKERTPTLVSWNGNGFDLPIIHYRTLKHNIVASGYWEKGANDTAFLADNYLNRYHDRHTDLMDVLASYKKQAVAPLDHIASLLGFPGNMINTGKQVWDDYLAGRLAMIREQSEIEALNIYLVYLRYQYMRGEINQETLTEEYNLVRETLLKSEQEHLKEFEKSWA